MARRRYTKGQKAEVVGIAAMEGQRGASEITGIPLSTIHSWMNSPEFAQLRTEKREAVEEMFWAGIQVGLKAVIEGLSGDAKLGEKSVALGILYDKHALLTGGATGRTESRDLTGTLSDADVQVVIREAEHLLGAGTGRTPETPEDPPAG